MSSEVNEMVVHDKYGTITYNQSVFSGIARNVVDESEAIEVAEGSKLFKTEHVCRIEDGKLYITLPVRVAYNSNVTDVCSQAQTRIYESIKYMTDYQPESIVIQVVGFIF